MRTAQIILHPLSSLVYNDYMTEMKTLLLKIPRNTEVTPEASQTFLSALTSINGISNWDKLLGKKAPAFALEIALINQQIHFLITADESLLPLIETQLQSNYPLVIIEKFSDPLKDFEDDLHVKYLKLSAGSFYPLALFTQFKDVDPLSSVLSVMAKADPDFRIVIQFALESVGNSWQGQGASYAAKGSKNEDGTYKDRSDSNVIKEKISYPGFALSLRIASNTNKTLNELAAAFGVFTRSDGNSLKASTPGKFSYKKEVKGLLGRHVYDKQIVNVAELATLWHLPSEKTKVPSIVWGTNVLSEPPTDLPNAIEATDEEKQSINFFAKTLYKNRDTIFGIKDKDRLRHIWSVGKTGTGKSTLIANMAIDDARKGRGFGVIDPHGDLCLDIINFIPNSRVNDTIYFNPADRDFPISINPLEVNTKEEAELVVSGLMAIFTKVWANVWSARMEYILRNAFLTLTEVPDATLPDVLRLLSSQSYRNKILKNVNDQAIVNFWKEEFDQMPDKLQKEAIAPIQNKVGQFVTSPLIRRIISNPKSSVAIEDIMDDGKILLANMSQGRLGEDNAQLLGAMLITKFQTAAMRRVDMAEDKRNPFYLYVDEFQNFATSSFIKILSEARKYKLGLMLANQYIAQIPEGVQKALLGNCGTLVTFTSGAEDAAVLHKEFAEVFSQNDLVNMQRFQIALKLMIDSHTSRPFLANTLPMPAQKNDNKEKIIRVSRERWTAKITKEMEEKEKELENLPEVLTKEEDQSPPPPHPLFKK